MLLLLAAGAAVSALQLENSRLREEVDSLRRRLPALGLLRRTSSSVQLAGAATEQLVAELAQVRNHPLCVDPCGCTAHVLDAAAAMGLALQCGWTFIDMSDVCFAAHNTSHQTDSTRAWTCVSD
jgi:hypothetical protein